MNSGTGADCVESAFISSNDMKRFHRSNTVAQWTWSTSPTRRSSCTRVETVSTMPASGETSMTYPHRKVSIPPMASARTAAAAIIQRAVSREKKPGRARNRWRNCSANSDGTSSAATAFLTSCLIRARLSISRVQSAQDLKCSSRSLLVSTGSSSSRYASKYRRYVSQDRPLNLSKFISSPPVHFPSCSLKDGGPQVYSPTTKVFRPETFNATQLHELEVPPAK